MSHETPAWKKRDIQVLLEGLRGSGRISDEEARQIEERAHHANDNELDVIKEALTKRNSA